MIFSDLFSWKDHKILLAEYWSNEEVLRKMGKKMVLLLRIQKTVEISVTSNEERGLWEFNSHRMKKKMAILLRFKKNQLKYVTYNEERGLEEFGTHRVIGGKKDRGKQWVTYLTSSCDNTRSKESKRRNIELQRIGSFGEPWLATSWMDMAHKWKSRSM